MVAMGLLAMGASCDRQNPVGDVTEGPNSVVPLGRPTLTMAPELFQAHVEALLRGEHAAPSAVHAVLERFPPERLWDLLSSLPEYEEESGRRMGLAVVILGLLAEKAPVEAVSYLVGDDSEFGLLQSAASLMAFRRAMTGWVAEVPQAAFEALSAYEAHPIFAERLQALAGMHGERLSVTLTSAMPLDDLGALTDRWDLLERKEAASTLPRILRRLESEEAREAVKDRAAAWLTAEWESEGPGAVFEWAVGLGNDAIQEDVLRRVKKPLRDIGEDDDEGGGNRR